MHYFNVFLHTYTYTHTFVFSKERERERNVCEGDAYSMCEMHSGLEVYKALIDLKPMANGWSVFFRSL